MKKHQIAVAAVVAVASISGATVGGTKAVKHHQCSSLERNVVGVANKAVARFEKAAEKISPSWSRNELNKYHQELGAYINGLEAEMEEIKGKWESTCLKEGSAPEVKGENEAVDAVNKANAAYWDSFQTAAKMFRTDKAWNSAENRAYLETAIVTNAVERGTERRLMYTSASCSPQTTPNFWNCRLRLLGETYHQDFRIEVNPKNGSWQAG